MRRAALIAALTLAGAAFAVEPDEMLADPSLERRAQAIDRELRCVVCQSQSIAESDAPLAKDMRLIVRERIAAGDSDREVFAFLRDRYGDYVLARPPVQANTIALWAFPPAILLAGLALGLVYARRARTLPKPAALTDEERRRIDALLNKPPAERSGS